jgi:hypothetical protein
MQVAPPQDAAREPPPRRGTGPGAVAAQSAGATGAVRQLVNSSSANSTADSPHARLAQAARVWSLDHSGSGGAAGSGVHVQNGHTLGSGHMEYARGTTALAPCPAASAPSLQQPEALVRIVLAPASQVSTLPAAVRAALSLQPQPHPAQLRTAGPDEQAGAAAGGPVFHGAPMPDTTLQLPQHGQAPPPIWPGSFLYNSSRQQQQQQQQHPSSPHHAQHVVAEPEQPIYDAPATTAATTHAPLDSFNWHENLPEEVSVPVVNFWLFANDTWTLSCATTCEVICDLQSELKLASVSTIQDIRLSAERGSEAHSYLWTPDASQDAEDAPNRAAFLR